MGARRVALLPDYAGNRSCGADAGGRVYRDRRKEEVLGEGALSELFGIPVEVLEWGGSFGGGQTLT